MVCTWRDKAWCTNTVVRITEGLRQTEAGRLTDEAATKTDQVQATAACHQVTTGQDADHGCYRQ